MCVVDYDIVIGVWLDMIEYGWVIDEWFVLYWCVFDVYILVLCGLIWLGDNSLVMKWVIECLYVCLSLFNEDG